LANVPNAALLADFMKTRVHAGMGADQLAALPAQPQPGARTCAHGHPARASEQFCASCGAPLSS
jgi:hypothetical protein